LIPKQTDVGAALPGDDPSSVVHADRNAAIAAIAAAAAGPAGRKSPMRKQEFAVAVNLESDPRMASYNVYIRHALANQEKRRRDLEYDWPSTIKALANGAPAASHREAPAARLGD